MEFGSIEREIRIDASPEVVYDVISKPEHLREWFPDVVDLDPTPGARGRFVFGDPDSPDAHIAELTVVDADPYRSFSFRWTEHDGNALLAHFELTPVADGTLLRLTESGFREMGWEAAVLEAQYVDHCAGWDHHLARLVTYVATLVAAE